MLQPNQPRYPRVVYNRCKEKMTMRSLLASLSIIGALFGAKIEEKSVPIAILGGGVGAMTSAIYLERAGVDALVIEGPNPGGLIAQSHAVQNWPSELEINGVELATKIRAQAEANGAHFSHQEVIEVDFSKRPYTIVVRDLASQKTSRIRAESVIIAMGSTPNYLKIPGEETYWGRGVSNCAVCDGNLYRDQTVAIVGGGDAALIEGLYLANIAKQVHLFVRKTSFKTVEEKRLQTLLSKPNVKIHYNTRIEEVRGDGEKVVSLVAQSNKKEQIPVDALFLAIGSKPNTALFQGQLPLDENGYILLESGQKTKLDGIYAIGDIADPFYKQAISAAGDGAKAAIQAQQYLSDRTNLIVKAASIETPSVQAPLAEVIEITNPSQFERELASSEGPVLVDFYATWCGPCRQISPLIETSAHELSGKVKFLKVNVDLVSSLAKTYQIRAMPTALLLSPDGKLLERKVGTHEISMLLHELSQQENP